MAVQQLRFALAFGFGEEGRVARGSRDEEVTQPPASNSLELSVDNAGISALELRRGCILGKKLKRKEDGKAYL